MTAPSPTSPPPPPPPPVPSRLPDPAILALTAPRPGQLTLPWRIMVAATWTAVFFAYSAVWKASEEIGIATWWLGPRSEPQPVLVRLIPFAIAIVVAVVAIYNLRLVSWVALGGALAAFAVAIPDFQRSTGLAVVELAIAGAALAVSGASFAGRYRRAAPGASGPPGAGGTPLPPPDAG